MCLLSKGLRITGFCFAHLPNLSSKSVSLLQEQNLPNLEAVALALPCAGTLLLKHEVRVQQQAFWRCTVTNSDQFCLGSLPIVGVHSHHYWPIGRELLCILQSFCLPTAVNPLVRRWHSAPWYFARTADFSSPVGFVNVRTAPVWAVL